MDTEIQKELFKDLMDSCKSADVDPDKILSEMRLITVYLKDTRNLSAIEGLLVMTHMANTLFKTMPRNT